MTTQPPTLSNSIDGSAPTIDAKPYTDGRSFEPPTVLGDFLLEREIGRGGMGIVYRAIEQGLGRAVALKVLPDSGRLTASRVSRFQLEAKSAAQLTHDHIVPVYHVGYEKGTHYFAMRLIEGSNIEKLITDAKRTIASLAKPPGTHAASEEVTIDSNQATSDPTASHHATSNQTSSKPVASAAATSVQRSARSDEANRVASQPQASVDTQLDLSLASLSTSAHSGAANGTRAAHRLAVCIAQIGRAVADALHHAHQHGIIHRDIKPSNLMIDDLHKVWVTDFGLAQLQGEDGLTKSGEFVGTLRYMSPEQASGRRVFVDHRTDIYSLGVTLYEMATLQKACLGESPQEILRHLTFSSPVPVRRINPRLPKDFEAILSRAMERNPAVRYQSAAEFALDLSRFARGEPLLIYRPQRIKRVLSWLIDRPKVAATITAFTALACTSLLIIVMLANHATEIQSSRADLAEEVVSVREAQQLSAGALLVKDENPGLAIAAAIEGATGAVGPPSENALMAALNGNHERRTIAIESDNAGDLTISPDGRLAIVCTDPMAFAFGPTSVPVIETATGKILGRLACQTPITEALFDPTGKTILTNSTAYRGAEAAVGSVEERARGELQLWDAQSLRLLKTLTPSPAMRISQANFSADGRRLVLPTASSSATVYDLPGLQPVMVLPSAHNGPVLDATFSHDGQRIATWAEDGQAIAWDATNGQRLQSIEYRTDLPLSVTLAFTNDHDRLCISGRRGTRVVSIKDGSTLFSRQERLLGSSATAHWIYLLSLKRDSVQAVNLDTGIAEFECLSASIIRSGTLSADGTTVALACGDTVNIFDGRSGQQLASLRGHTDEVVSTAVIPSQQQIASISHDGTLRLWNIKSDLQLRTLSPLVEKIRQHILTLDATGTLAAIGNIRSDRTSLRDVDHPNSPITQFTGSFQLVLANGQLLTTGPGACWLWDTQTQRKIQSIELPGDPQRTILSALELSPHQLLLLCDDQQLLVWNLLTDSLSRFTKTAESVQAIVKVAENQAIVGMSNGDLVQFVAPSLERKLLHRFGTGVIGLSLKASENQLLVSTFNNDLILWNLTQQTIDTTTLAIEERMTAVIPLANGRCISHAHMHAKSLKVWNPQTQTMEKELPVDGGVRHCIVSDDGASAVVLTGDRVMVWHWEENQVDTVIQRACATATIDGNKLLLITKPIAAIDTPAANDLPMPELIVWDMDSRMTIRTEKLDVAADAKMTRDASGKFWLSSRTAGVDIVDIASNQILASVSDLNSEIVTAQFLPAGDELLTVTRAGSINATRFRSGQRRLIGNQGQTIKAVAVSPDGRLLLTADPRGDIWKWNLTTASVMDKVETQGKAVTWLSISQSGNTAVALLTDNEVLLMDLRTGATTRHVSAMSISSASLSDEGSKLLITGSQDMTVETSGPTQSASAQRLVAELITLGTPKPFALRAAYAEAVQGEFISGDKFVVLLTNRGTALILDVATGQTTTSIVTPRPITQLLGSTKLPDAIFAVSGQQITGWTSTGNQTSAFSIPGLNTELRQLNGTKLMRAKDSPWYLVFANDQVVKQPVQPLKYAEQIAPRKLTEPERRGILWTPSKVQ